MSETDQDCGTDKNLVPEKDPVTEKDFVTEKVPVPEKDRGKDKEKKNGVGMSRGRKAALIVAVSLLVLLLASAFYLAFINTDTYIAIREYFAESYLDKGEAEEAIELYEKILTRDGTYVPAYLGEAEACLMLGDYEVAEQVLSEGMHYADPAEPAWFLWEVYAEHAEVLLEDGRYNEALKLCEGVPVQQLTECAGGDAESETRLGAVWAEATLALAKKEADREKAVEMLETAMDAPYNGYTDTSVFKEELLRLYLELARESETKDDKPRAILYYESVLELDPENEEAKEALERLKEVPVEIPKKLEVTATVKLGVEVSYLGIKIQLPFDAEAQLRYDGTVEGKEWLKGKVVLSGEILGKSIKEERSVTAYQDGADLCYRIDNGDLERLKDEKLPEDLNLFLESYRELVSQSSSGHETATVNGELCRVERKEMNGKSYVDKLPSFLQDGKVADFLESIRLNVTRYISVSEDRVVRVEATLLEADQKGFADLVKDFINMDLNVSLKTMDAVIDIKEEM
ncbi:MAG: tetratricopeptide repeat protein [Lachnospiraceae bacterium]|nr:tetratricopeptide repeat protein [Lachnospiraceae bacterium]